MGQRTPHGCLGSRGQSTLEYTLIIAAVIAAVAIAAGSLVHPAVTNNMTKTSDVITGASDKLKTGLGL